MLILLALGVFLAVILVRAALFRPTAQSPVAQSAVAVDSEKLVRDMAAMIQCKTVSHRDDTLTDWAEFEKFQALLKERFPLVHQTCLLQKIGKTGLLYHWKGSSAQKPSVCMAHYDVVPADEARWSKPPFAGIVEDGVLWGRGTLDTKGTLCGILTAAETLLQAGFTPAQDVYFSFSGEEEIDGASCADIVSYLEENNIQPSLVLDEGGAVVEKVFPGVTKECAVVGIGEKGSLNLEFSMESEGGHASAPPVHTTIGCLSQAIVNLEKHPFPRQLAKPVREMFDVLGRYSTFGYRIIFANLWCFTPLLDLLCRKMGGELNALMRTTVAVTRAQGSEAYNVLPPVASFGVNMRLLGSDTVDSAVARMNKTIDNDKITARVVSGMNPSPHSTTACAEWETLRQAIQATWPDAIVSPYLMMACSDSRHYCRISDKVYRFSAMKLSKEERGMIHGNDERVPIDTLAKTAAFYVRLLKSL